MLYKSTRNKLDSFTAHRALHEEIAADGGMYVPFRLVTVDSQQLLKWKNQPAGEVIAHILNGFFGLSLTAWDVECAIGRTPFRTVGMNRRMIVAECWRNLGGSWEHMVTALYTCIGGKVAKFHGWTRIAIEIAMLFGVFTQMEVPADCTFDLCAAGGDFATVAAALYAKDMGLPVGKILCVCNENSSFWDLLQRGEYNTAAAVTKTTLPQLDIARPRYLEYLLHRAFGVEIVEQYLKVCEKGGVFYLEEESRLLFTNELLATVSSSNRVDSVISSLYRTNGYIADPVTAFTYGGLQDYRASSGISNHTLLLSKESPAGFADRAARIMGLTKDELTNQINSPKE